MKPLRPYKIDVFNMAGQSGIGSFYSNQVPQAGELVSFYGDSFEGDPFRGWGLWRVETVMWQIAHRGSMTGLELAREAEAFVGESYCTEIGLLVWPANGPHFWKRPKWAPEQEEDDDEEADVP